MFCVCVCVCIYGNIVLIPDDQFLENLLTNGNEVYWMCDPITTPAIIVHQVISIEMLKTTNTAFLFDATIFGGEFFGGGRERPGENTFMFNNTGFVFNQKNKRIHLFIQLKLKTTIFTTKFNTKTSVSIPV